LSLEEIDLLALVEDTVEDARLEAEPDGKSIVVSNVAPAQVRGDRSLILSAIENVLRNAVRFGRRDAGGGLVGGHRRRRPRPVSDSGPGMAPADSDRLRALTAGARTAPVRRWVVGACRSPDRITSCPAGGCRATIAAGLEVIRHGERHVRDPTPMTSGSRENGLAARGVKSLDPAPCRGRSRSPGRGRRRR